MGEKTSSSSQDYDLCIVGLGKHSLPNARAKSNDRRKPYAVQLQCLNEIIKQKLPNHQNQVILQYENTRSHTVQLIKIVIQAFHCKILLHLILQSSSYFLRLSSFCYCPTKYISLNSTTTSTPEYAIFTEMDSTN